MTSTFHEGGCLCGAVRYRVRGSPRATAACHCRSCRLASGATPVAWAVFNRSDLDFVTGAPVRFASSSGVTRSFCGRCGTPLAYQTDDSPQTIDVTTATLDRPDAFPPTKEIWLDHKVSWVPLDEKLPHFATTSRPPAGG
jgi:hypothetical protein